MIRLLARKLLNSKTGELWNTLVGDFVLVFDDGEILTNARRTIYSSFAWDFHRAYPRTPLLKSHHVDAVLKGDRLTSSTHLKLFRNVAWDTYYAYLNTPEAFRVEDIAQLVYLCTNNAYNELVTRCTRYQTSLSYLDFIEVLKNPAIRKIKEEMKPTAESIRISSSAVLQTLKNEPSLAENRISKAVRSSTVNAMQAVQCIGPRGTPTDTDSNLFQIPIMRGYAEGLRLFYDLFTESKSAAKSLAYSKEPLQDAEYFSRRLQLIEQSVRNLHQNCDCGTRKTTPWLVTSDDLPNLVGMHYRLPDGNLCTIQSDSHDLIGKTLELRTVIHCDHPDPVGVCSTCFGEFSLSVPSGTNLGHMACTSMNQVMSQMILSVKHLDGNAEIDWIVLDRHAQQFLAVGQDGSSYHFASSLQGKDVSISLHPKQVLNLTDINQVSDVSILETSRITDLVDVGFHVNHENGQDFTLLEVNLGNRRASFTHDFLNYIKTAGWSVDSRGRYVISLAGWDFSKVALALPKKNYSMVDHVELIAAKLEARVKERTIRANDVSPDDFLHELSDLINSKMSIPVAIIAVVELGMMIKSAEERDYGFPKASDNGGLGVKDDVMFYRSFAPLLAYQGHRDAFVSPDSFTVKNRPPHPMDYIIMPKELYDLRKDFEKDIATMKEAMDVSVPDKGT